MKNIVKWIVPLLLAAVAAGADGVRIAKCESTGDVIAVEKAVEAAEEEFRKEKGRTLLMAALLGFVTFALATEERVVDWPEQKVVEVDRSWLDPCYVYYEYRGPLVRGAGALTTSQRSLPGP